MNDTFIPPFTEEEAHTIKKLGLYDTLTPWADCPRCGGEGELGEEEWRTSEQLEELWYTCSDCGCKWLSITLYRPVAMRKIIQ